jgi:predicted nucleic acid-binding protein
MKYVIDSSVAFKWVVPEPYTDKARQLRADFENAVHDLLAPDVFPIEIGHALTRAERQKRIPVGAAVPLLTDVLRTLPRLQSSDNKLVKILQPRFPQIIHLSAIP